jgi:lysozyme
MLDKLKERIKTHEGFRNYCYKDSLGKLTVGWGHLCLEHENWDEDESYEIDVLEQYFEKDFQQAVAGAEELIGERAIPLKGKEVIIEMVFQLGKNGVRKFKKMWKAFDRRDFKCAAKEMLDSKWHQQTPNRAKSLATIVETLV